VYVGVGIDGDFGEPTEGYVIVIDSSTNDVEGVIGNISIPLAMEVNPSNGKVYVANAGSNSITVIDSSTNTVEDVINLNAPATALQYNDANGDLYVTVLNQQSSRDNGFVAIIDGSSNEFKDVYAVGVGPRQIEYNPTDNNIYVANSGSGDAYVIDSESNISTNLIPVGRATALEYNPSNHNIYIAISRDGEMEAIKIIASDRPASESLQDLQLQKLIEFIKALLKESGSTISTNLLNKSLEILTDDNPNNDMEICNILEPFADEIITPNQSDDLETILKC
jgi:YVTN family beta-propeller protein